MKTPLSIFLGIIAGLALFLLMYSLISNELTFDKDSAENIQLDFVHVEEDQQVKFKERVKPPPPPPPKEPPPPPKMEIASTDKPPPTPMDFEAPDIDLPSVSGQGPYLGKFSAAKITAADEGDAIPIVRIEPKYPRKAAIDGIEGWVKLEFTINPDGTVSSPKVLSAKPRRIFDSEAKRAILRWKYKPRVVDGKAVARQWQTTIEFKF